MRTSAQRMAFGLAVGATMLCPGAFCQTAAKAPVRVAGHALRLSSGAEVQEWVAAPLVGLAATPDEGVVRAILGVAGSSTLGPPIEFPEGAGRVFLSPGQRWALVEQSDGAPLGLVAFNLSAAGAAKPIEGAMNAPDVVEFSPAGRSAVLFSRTDGRLQVLTGLDGTPRIASEVQLPHLAEARAFSVDDAATTPLLLAEDGNLYALRDGAGEQLVFRTSGNAGIAFLPDRDTAVVAGGEAGTVTLIENLNTTPAPRSIAEVPALEAREILVRAAADGRSIMLAARGERLALKLDMESGAVQTLELPVAVTRLERLRGGDDFLFSAEAGEPAWLIAGDRNEPRALFAAAPAEAAPVEEIKD